MRFKDRITHERKAWARAKLLVAWLKISKAVEDPNLTLEQLDEYETELRFAMAIADEWGVDYKTAVQEAEHPRR